MVRLETQYAENNDTSKHGGGAVDHWYEERVFSAVVFDVVVRRVSDHSSEAESEREEDLRRRIFPRTDLPQLFDLFCFQELSYVIPRVTKLINNF